MISNNAMRVGIKELLIFNSFVIDTNLPKYKRIKNESTENITIELNPSINVSNTGVNESWGGNSLLNSDDLTLDVPTYLTLGVDGNGYSQVKRKIKYLKWILNVVLGRPNKNKTKTTTILNYFTEFHENLIDLRVTKETLKYYNDVYLQAKKNGQVSLCENMKNLIDVFKYESILCDIGLNKYVSEEQLCDFYLKTDENKNLKLDWIKNFSRVIPKDISELKSKLDDYGIFDNYVILHYDPQNSSSQLTKEEKEIKKDPILFGLISKSRKLYYIADWKDEFCDLTLEKMFEVLKENVLTINNETIKTYINLGEESQAKRSPIKSKSKKTNK